MMTHAQGSTAEPRINAWKYLEVLAFANVATDRLAGVEKCAKREIASEKNVCNK